MFQHLENYNIWSPFGSEGAGYRKFYCINLLLFTVVLVCQGIFMWQISVCPSTCYCIDTEIIFSVVASVQH